MNLCFGERMRRFIQDTDSHTDLQLTHPFCPAHTRSPSAYILSGRHSREFKEGDFQRGQTQRGAQPSFVGPPLIPCRRHAPQRLSPQKKTNQSRTDCPDNNIALIIAAPREYIHARPSEWNERLREHGCSVTLSKNYYGLNIYTISF